ncbi:VOC family protein [Amnibacterium kyonggiense]
MPAPTPYLHFAGCARTALEFYGQVFGGEVTVHSYEDFGRTDGPRDHVAHGELRGVVSLFAADVGDGQQPFAAQGLLLSLLGAEEPPVLERWFTDLSAAGEVVDPLQRRAWGAHDGQVRDRFGVTWLIGYEGG